MNTKDENQMRLRFARVVKRRPIRRVLFPFTAGLFTLFVVLAQFVLCRSGDGDVAFGVPWTVVVTPLCGHGFGNRRHVATVGILLLDGLDVVGRQSVLFQERAVAIRQCCNHAAEGTCFFSGVQRDVARAGDRNALVVDFVAGGNVG